MNKLLTIVLLISPLLLMAGVDKKLKKVVAVDKQKDITEIYHVRKSDRNIRQGEYIYYAGGKLLVQGFYDNNRRTGVWRYYNYFSGNLTRFFDFEQDTLLNYFWSDDESKLCDVRVNGKWEKKAVSSPPFPKFTDLPTELALRLLLDEHKPSNVSGKLAISIQVDAEGNLVGCQVVSSSGSLPDAVLVNMVKGVKVWYPAICNEKKVESKYLIDINFE